MVRHTIVSRRLGRRLAAGAKSYHARTARNELAAAGALANHASNLGLLLQRGGHGPDWEASRRCRFSIQQTIRSRSVASRSGARRQAGGSARTHWRRNEPATRKLPGNGTSENGKVDRSGKRDNRRLVSLCRDGQEGRLQSRESSSTVSGSTDASEFGVHQTMSMISSIGFLVMFGTWQSSAG